MLRIDSREIVKETSTTFGEWLVWVWRSWIKDEVKTLKTKSRNLYEDKGNGKGHLAWGTREMMSLV